MTAAAYTIEHVPGAHKRQAIGQFVAQVIDIKWASAISNGTADATITAATLGLQHIHGAFYIGEGGSSGTITDHPDACQVRVARAGTQMVVTAVAAGSALDLDASDIASVRLIVLGV